MRTLFTSYLFIIFLAAIVALLYPSCELVQTGHALSPISATITLDFFDPNTRHDVTGGFRYIYQDSSYLATCRAWETWSCATGPDFFAAWDDDSRTVWLANCPVRVGLAPARILPPQAKRLPTKRAKPA